MKEKKFHQDKKEARRKSQKEVEEILFQLLVIFVLLNKSQLQKFT